MKSAIASLGLVIYLAGAVSGRAALSVGLATEDSKYLVGEPVHLTLSVTNDGDTKVLGFFDILVPETSILYHLKGEPYAPVFPPERVTGERDIMREPAQLAPGKTRVSSVTLAWDGNVGRMLLDRPGDYEFYVECRPTGKSTELSLRSNVVHVHVELPPVSDRDALAEYSKEELARFLQFLGMPARRDTVKAAKFLDRFPLGRYSELLRPEVMRTLEGRVKAGVATPEEKGLFDRLGGQRPADQRN